MGTLEIKGYPSVKGTMKLFRVMEFTTGDRGQTLSELRSLFGGKDEGYITDMVGDKHFFSLKPWAKADPNVTRLEFAFQFEPSEPLPENHPEHPNFDRTELKAKGRKIEKHGGKVVQGTESPPK